jgi:hypothetical protein
MEFLLQLFADFLGTPPQEEKVEESEEITVNEKSAEMASATPNENVVEEPLLFGLMQFH